MHNCVVVAGVCQTERSNCQYLRRGEGGQDVSCWPCRVRASKRHQESRGTFPRRCQHQSITAGTGQCYQCSRWPEGDCSDIYCLFCPRVLLISFPCLCCCQFIMLYYVPFFLSLSLFSCFIYRCRVWFQKPVPDAYVYHHVHDKYACMVGGNGGQWWYFRRWASCALN